MRFLIPLFFLMIILISCESDENIEENLCEDLTCDLVCENGLITDENDCEVCECIIFGCTNPDATNYNEDANTDLGDCIYNYVYAGIFDDNFTITEFIPPLEIDLVWDEDNLYAFGNISFDIDENGVDDLLFNQTNYNLEYIEQLIDDGISFSPYYFPSAGLTPSDDVEFAFIEVGFYAGLGSYSSTDFVYRINYQDRIDNLSLWKESYAAMFQENPTTIFPFGPWHATDGTYYIAIRKNNKFGWIEIEMNGLNTYPKISKIAFQTFYE